VFGSVKFHRPVKPGDAFTLRYRVAGSHLSFRCVSGEQLLAEGAVSLGAAAAESA
jgi:hypothetical protein